MSCWIQIPSWANDTTLGGVADVHRIVLQRQAQERAIFLDQVVIVDSAARHGEDDVVVLDRSRVWRRFKCVVIAVPMKSVGHLSSDLERPKIEDGRSKISILYSLCLILDFFGLARLKLLVCS